MNTIYYFAYGSNLHPLRLIQRVPSAELIGVATYSRHRLLFHKKTNDGSSKCNIFNTETESDLIHGAIYRLKREHKNELDGFEGKGYGYTDTQIILKHGGIDYTCFTYFAQKTYIVDNMKPYHWYKRLVVLGAQYLDFPTPYISSIEAVESIEDPDSKRKFENELLIESIINYR